MFWIIRFILFWVIFILFADKRRWREILPVCIFAGFLGATVDSVMHHTHLWIFESEQTSLLADISDDWSVYIVVTYLFIQWLPQDRAFFKMAGYWFIWAGISAVIELVHIYTGNMAYSSNWNIGWSYFADWILFYLFYEFYLIFGFKRLTP